MVIELLSKHETVKIRKAKKPGVLNPGNFKTRDSSKHNKRSASNTSILSGLPNFSNEIGKSMSKIPYLFETPIPKYFREMGWFDNENTLKFVTWAFSKCSTESHKIIMDGKEIILEPFEFVCGRRKNSNDCFLSQKEFRGQLFSMVEAGLLKKGANSRANRFSTYIWVTDRFSKQEGQLKGQQRAHLGPTKGHNQDDKKIRYKDHQSPTPLNSFDLIDDSFSKKIHVCREVYLTQNEINECLKVWNSLEIVEQIICQAQDWKGRKNEIKDWVTTIKNWKFTNSTSKRISEHEVFAAKLVEDYGEVEKGWQIRIYDDKIKHDKGLLFECIGGAHSYPVFISFLDGNFKKKVKDLIECKYMKLKG
jgi:hypothetical protein